MLQWFPYIPATDGVISQSTAIGAPESLLPIACEEAIPQDPLYPVPDFEAVTDNLIVRRNFDWLADPTNLGFRI